MDTLFTFALLLFQIQGSDGYYLENGNLVFIYTGQVNESIYVSGNFNNWTKKDEQWKMKFDKESGAWKLQVPGSKVKDMGKGFYEFTFRVDGKLMDADKKHESTIHCAGHGYRYVIHGLW